MILEYYLLFARLPFDTCIMYVFQGGILSVGITSSSGVIAWFEVVLTKLLLVTDLVNLSRSHVQSQPTALLTPLTTVLTRL